MSMAPPLRIYVDTSVIGGCFDLAFAAESQALIQRALNGEIILIISDLLLAELVNAPAPVRTFFASLPAAIQERMGTTAEADRLHQAYMAAAVVGPAAENDAQHVANATVARADAIVSWNMKHIVHMEKIRAYNEVNTREGYGRIEIYTPAMVI
jgi:predicted nucleic acid-binding protein